MFNPKRKDRYIKWKTSHTITPDGGLQRLFKKTDLYEKRLGKDVCNFVENEILNFYKVLGTRSVGSIINMNSQLAQYTDWCMHQGLVADGQNHFRILKKVDFESCVNVAAIKKIATITREDLLKEIKALPNAREQFLILYFFEVGTRDIAEELESLTIDQFEGNTVHLIYRDVEVSDQLVELARQAAEEHEIYPFKTGGRTSHYSVTESKLVVKMRESSAYGNNPSRRYYTLYTKAMNYIGLPMYKSKEIENMGKLHMLKGLAEEHGLSLHEAIQNPRIFNKIHNQYGLNENWHDLWRDLEKYA